VVLVHLVVNIVNEEAFSYRAVTVIKRVNVKSSVIRSLTSFRQIIVSRL
jgi:hypothetical protein